jgi:hypothetical protein
VVENGEEYWVLKRGFFAWKGLALRKLSEQNDI